MRTFDVLCKVHITAHTDSERAKATEIVGFLLGCGNLTVRTGYWPSYPEGEEPDNIYQVWLDSNELDIGHKFYRLCRYLVWLRVALRQEAIFFELFTPYGNRAVLVEEFDKPEHIYQEIAPLVDRGEHLANFFDNLRK